MATTIGKLAVVLSANASSFFTTMGKAASAVTGFAATVGSGGLTLVAGAALGVGAGLAAVTVGAFSAADAAGDLSDRLGVNVTQLTALQHAAAMTDVAQEDLTTGLGVFVKNLGQAGVATDDVLGSFAAVADQVAALKTPTEQAALAVENFGKGGVALLPLLRQGRAGLADLASEAQLLGAALDADDVGRIGAADNAFKRVKASLMGVGTALAGTVAPFLEVAAQKATALLVAVRPIAAALGTVVTGLAAQFLPAANVFGDANSILDWAETGTQAVLGFSNQGIAAVTDFANWLVQAGVGAFNRIVIQASAAGNLLISAFEKVTKAVASLFVGLGRAVGSSLLSMARVVVTQLDTLLGSRLFGNPLVRFHLGLLGLDLGEIRGDLQEFLKNLATDVDLTGLENVIKNGITDAADLARQALASGLPAKLAADLVPLFQVGGQEAVAAFFAAIRANLRPKGVGFGAGIGPLAKAAQGTPLLGDRGGLPGAFQRGSAEAVSLLNNFRSGQGHESPQEKALRELIEIRKQGALAHAQLVKAREALEKLGVVTA